MTANPSERADLSGRRVVVAVSGGIAAYKSCTLVSRLTQSGAEVSVIMTEAATKLVGEATFQSLSGRPVGTSLWEPVDAYDAQHIALARSCELLILVPATANTIAKIAHGICDNLVTTVINALPRTTPVLLAPAMNAEMWANPITQKNIAVVRDELGYELIGPESGWQACRTTGTGRMSEPETIYERAVQVLTSGA
jgi:phosphopantothenoylcysteine decarboxylase/phosphopantothenate--cysteine ligase